MKTLHIIIFFSGVIMIGCATKKNSIDPEYQAIKRQYSNIVAQQYDADKNDLLRTDWPSCSKTNIDNAYKHPIAWSAYLLYNFPLNVLKETGVLVSSPFTESFNLCFNRPTNLIQDNLDNSFHSKDLTYYPEMYYTFWSYSKKATHMNMDDYDMKKLQYVNNKQ